MIGGDVESHNDGGIVGGLHGFRNRRIGLRRDAEIQVAKINAVIMQLPGDDAIGDLSTTIADADGGLGDLRIPQILSIQLRLGNLVEKTLADLVYGEQPLLRFRVLRDHALIRLRIGSWKGSVPPSASACRAPAAL